MSYIIYIIISLFFQGFQGEQPEYLSPERCVVRTETGECYITLSSARKVAVFDPALIQLSKEISLPFNPNGIILDGHIMYISGGNEKGEVISIDLRNDEIVGRIPAGHTPGDLSLAAEEEILFVTNRFTNDISVIDLKSYSEIKRIPVTREPYAIDISPDESVIAVTNFLSENASTTSHVAASISLIDVNDLDLIRNIDLPNGSTSPRDICFTKDGEYIYVTHVLSRFRVPATQVTRGWINTSALSIIDVEKQEYLTTVLLDDINKGAANPCGITLSEDGSQLFVSISGTHELCTIDREAMHEKIEAARSAEDTGEGFISFDEISGSLNFLDDTKKRIPLEGNSPRYICCSGSKIIVPVYFSAGINIVETAGGTNTQFIALGKEPAMSEERLGKQHFHDASLCYQGWQSCSTCHTGNGRSDGLNWDLPADGFGNPYNTKSLLTSYQTPPVNHTGNVPDLATCVRGGINGSIFVYLPEEYAVALDAYLENLQPLKSPYLADGKLNASALRGKEIFVKGNCNKCHSGEYYTDLKKYDVGTGMKHYHIDGLDTPTLLETWRNGPYLHDGRAKSLEEVLTIYNRDDKHGKTSGLSPAELADLAEYVNSL